MKGATYSICPIQMKLIDKLMTFKVAFAEGD